MYYDREEVRDALDASLQERGRLTGGFCRCWRPVWGGEREGCVGDLEPLGFEPVRLDGLDGLWFLVFYWPKQDLALIYQANLIEIRGL